MVTKNLKIIKICNSCIVQLMDERSFKASIKNIKCLDNELAQNFAFVVLKGSCFCHFISLKRQFYIPEEEKL